MLYVSSSPARIYACSSKHSKRVIAVPSSRLKRSGEFAQNVASILYSENWLIVFLI